MTTKSTPTILPPERIARMGPKKLERYRPTPAIHTIPTPDTTPKEYTIKTGTRQAIDDPSYPWTDMDEQEALSFFGTKRLQIKPQIPVIIESPETHYAVAVSFLSLITPPTHDEPTTILTRARTEEAQGWDDGDLQPSEVSEWLPVSDTSTEAPMGTIAAWAPGPAICTIPTGPEPSWDEPITNRTDSVQLQ